MSKAKKVPVTISTRDGDKSVPGEVFGKFAVTPWQDLGGPRRGEYTVTHVPSGNAASRSWGGFPLRLAIARKVARYLDKHWTNAIHDDAGFGEAAREASKQWRKQNPKAYRDLLAGVRAIVGDLP